MRLGFLLAPALLASAAPAQRFGFTHRMVPAFTSETGAVALGDVDGDGDLDVLLGDGPPGSGHRLLANDGAGILADVTAGNLPATAAAVTATALGDLDGDGDLDAFLGTPSQVLLYLNGGVGAFADASTTNLPAQPVWVTAVTLGDIDGDGDLDAFVGTAGQSRLYRNAGGGATFVDITSANLPAVLASTSAVALGDVDGDGDLDAYFGNGEGCLFAQEDRLYLNAAGGVFTDVTLLNLPLLGASGLTRDLVLGDVDGDGDLDAVIGCVSENCGAGSSRLHLNVGGGVFADVTATNFPSPPSIAGNVALGDVDGDGDLDAWLDAATERLYLNGGGGVFTDASATNLLLPPGPSPSGDLAFGDLDGDGDLDMFAGSLGQDRLFLNDGGGTFADATGTDPPVFTAWSVALGDVDGDGDLDAMVGRAGQSLLLVGDGTGVFRDVTATNLPVLSAGTRAVALADLDGDGDLDAFLGILGNGTSQTPTGVDQVFLNGGTGVFALAPAGTLPGLDDPTTAIALGDVDGDGDLDAATGNGWYLGTSLGVERVYLNGGAGIFAELGPVAFPSANDATGGIALGDLDGDGDLDAYVANAGQDRLYLRGPAGTFVDATAVNLPADADITTSVALGDVDGDGDLDAFLGNSTTFFYPPTPGGQNRLYLNNGSALFVDSTAANLPVLVARTSAVALADVDEDGDLDAVIVNGSQQNRLYVNDGSGVFAEVTATDMPALSDLADALALGDVDGDGDLDAFVGGRLLANLTRQVSWRGIPRAGKTLTLDLRGPASGTWLLGAAAAPGDLPIPAVGTLRLELPTLFIVAGGTLDPQGLASLTFPVPANPALVGGSLFWQAVVGPPLRFTNLEVTTVTGL